MKKYITKLSLFLVVLVSVIFLGGCSFEYNITLKDNGVIEANINLDLKELDNNKVESISLSLEEYFKQLDRAFEKNTIELYSKIFDYEKLKEKYQLDTDEKLVGYILEYNDFVVNDSEIIQEGKRILFKKSFLSMRTQTLERSLTAYFLYFYPKALEYSEEEKDIVLSASYKSVMDDIPLSSELKKEQNAFIIKLLQTSHPFYYNGEEPKFLEDFTRGSLSVSAGTTIKQHLTDITGLSEQDIEMIFNFTTPYNRVHSNGVITQTKGGYTHSWKLGDVNGSVIFYRLSARPIMWYALAIGISLLVIVFGLITGVIIKNHKKKVGLQALKKIDELAHK